MVTHTLRGLDRVAQGIILREQESRTRSHYIKIIIDPFKAEMKREFFMLWICVYKTFLLQRAVETILEYVQGKDG